MTRNSSLDKVTMKPDQQAIRRRSLIPIRISPASLKASATSRAAWTKSWAKRKTKTATTRMRILATIPMSMRYLTPTTRSRNAKSTSTGIRPRTCGHREA